MQSLDDIINQVKVIEDTKIQKEKAGSNNGDPRILKFKVGNTYVLRLLLNLKAEGAEKIFKDFKEVGFNSRTSATTRYIYGGRSPTDAGIKKDLFKDTQWDHYSRAKKAGDEAEEKASFKLIAQRKQVANAYLVDVIGNDDEAKAKIGTNVIIRYAAQVDKELKPTSDLYKKIHSAILGEKSGKIGKKAFLLDEKGNLIKNGKDLIVKVIKNQGGWADYSESEFDDATELSLTDDQIVKIQEGVFDLNEFVPEVKSQEEIKAILDEHWYGTSASADDDVDTDDHKPSYQDKDDTSIPGLDSGGDGLDELESLIRQ